jgi:hypothetical protein
VFAKLQLNDKELEQVIPYFNGDYAEEYKNIRIPFSNKTVNLKEIDAKFIEKFSPYKQADMLAELGSVGRGEKNIRDVSFIHHLHDMISKAICPVGNEWMPSQIPCE